MYPTSLNIYAVAVWKFLLGVTSSLVGGKIFCRTSVGERLSHTTLFAFPLPLILTDIRHKHFFIVFNSPSHFHGELRLRESSLIELRELELAFTCKWHSDLFCKGIPCVLKSCLVEVKVQVPAKRSETIFRRSNFWTYSEFQFKIFKHFKYHSTECKEKQYWHFFCHGLLCTVLQ